MAFISLKPMMAFQQFDKSMTNGGLIVAICSAIGFAAVISYTKCDVHLVTLLTRPLKKLGFSLLPTSMLVTGFISVSIPTLSGLGAAVGPTMIPILLRAGFKPGCAAAAIVAATYPAYLNPGLSHNVFVSKLAGWEVMVEKWTVNGMAVDKNRKSNFYPLSLAWLFSDFGFFNVETHKNFYMSLAVS